MAHISLKYPGVPQTPKKPHWKTSADEPLYIGQWIRALGVRQIDVVRATGMNEGYLSELCSGKSKKNPSRALLQSIADALDIPVDYLRRPPPDQHFIQQASQIDPAIISRLKLRSN